MAEKDDSITEADEPTLRTRAPDAPAPSYPFVQARFYTRGPRATTLMLVVHTTESHEIKGSARNVAAYFRDPRGADGKPLPPDRGGSSQYVIDDQEVYQCVREEDSSWHAGPVNGYSIGIELVGAAGQTAAEWDDEYSRAVLARAAALAADICQRHGIPIRKLSPEEVAAKEPGICGHIDVTKGLKTGSHWDPGPAFPWGLFLAMIRAAAGLE